MFVVVTVGWWVVAGRITATTTNPSLCRWSSNHSYQHLRIRANSRNNTLLPLGMSPFREFPSIVFSDRLLSLVYDNCMKRRPYVLVIRGLSLWTGNFRSRGRIVVGAPRLKFKQFRGDRKSSFLRVKGAVGFFSG